MTELVNSNGHAVSLATNHSTPMPSYKQTTLISEIYEVIRCDWACLVRVVVGQQVLSLLSTHFMCAKYIGYIASILSPHRSLPPLSLTFSTSTRSMIVLSAPPFFLFLSCSFSFFFSLSVYQLVTHSRFTAHSAFPRHNLFVEVDDTRIHFWSSSPIALPIILPRPLLLQLCSRHALLFNPSVIFQVVDAAFVCMGQFLEV